MRLSEFTVRVTQSAGIVQRNIREGAPDVTKISQMLGEFEVYALVDSSVNRREFDIIRLGVEPDNTVRVEIAERWTWRRIFKIALLTTALLGSISSLISLTYELAFESGRQSIIERTDIQLPTLEIAP
jgi:hypothetical protein